MPRGGGSGGSSGGGSRSSGGGGGSRSSGGSGGSRGSSISSGSNSSSGSSSSGKSSTSSSAPSARITSTGKVDGRSAAVRSGDLKLTSAGTIDRRSASVKNGSILVTQEGGLDRRSAAYAGMSGSAVAPSSSSSTSSTQSPSRGGQTIFFASDGSIDGRSSLVRTGGILLKQDGQIDQRSAAVRDGRIRLTNDGSVDLRSSAAPSKESVTQSNVDKYYTEMVAERGEPSSEAQRQSYRDYAEYKITGQMKTGLLRHHNQAVKREQSESAYLSEKQAAHKLSLEVIVEMLSRKPGPRLSFETVRELRETVNPIDGFRIVFARTNTSLHRQLDGALLEKGFDETDQPLNKQEEERAIQACKTFSSVRQDLPAGLANVGIEFFRELKNQDGHSIWELSAQTQ